ncbi:molybdopterin-dependent oxidoreductase [Jiella sonneratiae]|uniref:Molybdopterin-dependent oxidoreductase n=1 Tax=Jiella sonneratiae TaxID=2816856 RepID=A0ABS3JBA6_9HYPH|nr:molybdopterin-dependent oxidoreductase [Jiella sonneratiae]MBO0906248.1 molybdopterin-dependent oxidoreductase [Jiella sonneratiae]
MSDIRYSAAHWGIYEIEAGPEGPRLLPMREDPDASPIGLHQLAPELSAMRVRRPAVRRSFLDHGPGARTELRGKEPFVEISWDEAIRLVAEELTRVRARHGNEAIFGGSYGWASAGRFHHAQSQIHRFLNSIGGYVAHRDSYSLGAARVVLPHVVGTMDELMKSHTSWDVLADHCELFVSFGGVPAKNAQISQAGAGRHRLRAALERMARAGCQFVNVSPLASGIETGGPVEWLAARPGSDTALMLGLAFEIHASGLHDREFLSRYCVGWERFEPYLTGASDGQPKSADWAAELTGLAAGRIRDLARRMGEKRTMINAAWSLQRADHGEQPFWMLVTLAAMLGQIGLPGGGFGLGYGCENSIGSAHARLSGPTLPQGRNAVQAFIPVARIADMLERPGDGFAYDGGHYRYPDIRLIYWAGGNPFHHHQDLGRLERAWQKPETIVVHEPFWTPTARRADIVLPVTTPTEREDISYATLEGYLVASRPVSPPLGAALDDYEIFRRIAAHLDVEDAFSEGRDTEAWLRHLYDGMRRRWADAGVALPDFDGFRAVGRIDLSSHDEPERICLEAFRADPAAAPLPTPSGRIEIHSETVAGFALADCPGHPVWLPPAEWLGAELAARYPLHLISDQPERRLHSQLDPSPHSRSGKIAGREPVTMHPADAAARGLNDGEVVELFNDRGGCLAGLRLSEAAMPGVVRLATGAWFDPDPETGRDRHGNPNVLTADRPASSLSQGCAAQSCLVEIRRPPETPGPPRPFVLPELIAAAAPGEGADPERSEAGRNDRSDAAGQPP